MAATITTSSSLSLPIFLSTSNPKPYNLPPLRSSSLPSTSPPNHPRRRTPLLLTPLPPTRTSLRRRRLHAVPEESLAAESVALVEQSQEIASSSGGDGVSGVISALLLVAFVGLSILTIGVIYIAVTDFLQKREKEKFEKEEAAAASKKSGKKKKVKARSGPKGFGQKIDEDEELD